MKHEDGMWIIPSRATFQSTWPYRVNPAACGAPVGCGSTMIEGDWQRSAKKLLFCACEERNMCEVGFCCFYHSFPFVSGSWFLFVWKLQAVILFGEKVMLCRAMCFNHMCLQFDFSLNHVSHCNLAQLFFGQQSLSKIDSGSVPRFANSSSNISQILTNPIAPKLQLLAFAGSFWFTWHDMTPSIWYNLLKKLKRNLLNGWTVQQKMFAVSSQPSFRPPISAAAGPAARQTFGLPLRRTAGVQRPSPAFRVWTRMADLEPWTCGTLREF